MFAVKRRGVDTWRVIEPAFNAGVGVGIAYRGLPFTIAITCAAITDMIDFVTQLVALGTLIRTIPRIRIAVFVTVAEVSVIRTISGTRTLDR